MSRRPQPERRGGAASPPLPERAGPREPLRRPGRAAETAVRGQRPGNRRPRLRILRPGPPGSRPRAGRATAQWGRHRLDAASVRALRTAGMFRAVDCADLDRACGSRAAARRAVRALQAAGLLRVERFRRGSRSLEAASPTASGRRLLLRAIDPRAPGDAAAQGYRAGPARASQVLHDTAVYRAARIEIDALERRGGRVLRVVLDDDLQAGAWGWMDRARRGGLEPEAARAAAAGALGLEVRAGKLLFPDVRIEGEEPRGDGRWARFAVDVEVTTAAYRGPALRAKAAAGFRLYALGGDGALRGPEPGPEAAR